MATELKVGGKYQILKRLGEGAFGKVYFGQNAKTQEQVAIKLEKVHKGFQPLSYEAEVLKRFDGVTGFPQVHHFSRDGEFNALVLSLHGANFMQLFNFCENKFNLKTVLQLGIQMVSRLQIVHNKGYLHRDLKPQNILAGLGKKEDTFYLIDFGLAKRYICAKTGNHIAFKKNKGVTGTPNYLSLSSHRGNEHSRRDDLESLGLIMIYFLQGSLPWDITKPKMIPIDLKDPRAFDKRELNISNEKNWKRACLKTKFNSSIEKLCEGLPSQIAEFVHYCRKLEFEQEPDYAHLKQILKTCMVENGIGTSNKVWDWAERKAKKLAAQEQRMAEWKLKQACEDDGESSLKGLKIMAKFGTVLKKEATERKSKAKIAKEMEDAKLKIMADHKVCINGKDFYPKIDFTQLKDVPQDISFDNDRRFSSPTRSPTKLLNFDRSEIKQKLHEKTIEKMKEELKLAVKPKTLLGTTTFVRGEDVQQPEDIEEEMRQMLEEEEKAFIAENQAAKKKAEDKIAENKAQVKGAIFKNSFGEALNKKILQKLESDNIGLQNINHEQDTEEAKTAVQDGTQGKALSIMDVVQIKKMGEHNESSGKLSDKEKALLSAPNSSRGAQDKLNEIHVQAKIQEGEDDITRQDCQHFQTDDLLKVTPKKKNDS